MSADRDPDPPPPVQPASDGAAPPPPDDAPLVFPLPSGPGLLVLLLVAGLALAEWLLPPPAEAWTRPLLKGLGDGRVLLRPDDDPARHVELRRTPDRPRVAWLGASTVLGVPYDPELSPPRWLQLACASRGLDVEVVSVAAPGATSADVLHWLPEVLRLQPDAVVVSSGHNEWLLPGRWLDDSWSRRSDLLGWISRALGRAPREGPERPTAERPFDHGRVAARFRKHLLAWEALCADAGVPLVVTMPESNVADCPPVLDLELDGTGADAAWRRGRERLAVGDVQAARAQLRLARDIDAWPHRAPSLVQDVVKLEASRPVNVRKLFADASRGGIPGNDLFVDHCHPNPSGQRLLALAVADALHEAGAVVVPEGAPPPPDLETGQRLLGLGAEVANRARARAVKALLRLALLRPAPGPLAELVRQRVDAGWLGAADHGGHALLAALEGDAAELRRRVQLASPEDRRGLQLLNDAHPWVREALDRLDLVLVGGALAHSRR